MGGPKGRPNAGRCASTPATTGGPDFEDLDVELDDLGRTRAHLGPVAGVGRAGPGGGRRRPLDFHVAPRRQLVDNLTGSVEIETGSGERRVLGPGTILLAEDLAGEGDVSRHVGGERRICLFVDLAD